MALYTKPKRFGKGGRLWKSVLVYRDETRFLARWKLGRLLAKVDRHHGGDRSSSRAGNLHRDYLRKIGLNKNRANECERRLRWAR